MPDLSREALLNMLRALEPQLRAEGVERVALVGSRARCDNRPDSDIDLLVDVDGECRFSLLDLVGVAHKVEDATGLSANIFLRRSLAPEIAREMHSDLVEVFG